MLCSWYCSWDEQSFCRSHQHQPLTILFNNALDKYALHNCYRCEVPARALKRSDIGVAGGTGETLDLRPQTLCAGGASHAPRHRRMFFANIRRIPDSILSMSITFSGLHELCVDGGRARS